MIYLPDVNMWIALASRRHKHNDSAAAWMESAISDQVAFCRITELGLLRLLTNVHVMGEEVLDARGAWAVYDAIRMDPSVIFLREQADLSDQWSGARSQLTGRTNTITDAYLAVFAKHIGATVVTFDRGFKPIDGCDVMVLSQ